MNLGTAEAWTLGLPAAPDAERHLREGAALAREIGRPYLEVGCLAQLGFASLVLHSFATTQRRCREAIALAERHGWGAEPVIAPALIMLAANLIWTGEFDEGERWLQRTRQALQTDTGPDITLLLHQTAGLLHAGRGRHQEALEEFGAAEYLGSQLASRALATRTTRWLLATQARLGMTGEARALLAALDDERASSGEIRNAFAVICLAEGEPAAALAAVADVLDGTAGVLGDVTVIEAHLLAGLAHRELGDQRAAGQAAEQALALAESDRLVLPFAITGSRELLEALPRHQTAHAALLADILDILHSPPAAATEEESSLPPIEELSPGELKVLRYLPTNLSRPEIAGELSVSPNTVGTHLRSIYAKLQVRDRSSAVRRARELRLLAAGRTR
jgi:LuxR family maltose regulon positive regulatory protein